MMKDRSGEKAGGESDISSVVRDRLCVSCGACHAVCPVAAITFQETVEGFVHPAVDDASCTGCGLCLSVCPGQGFGKGLKRAMPPDPFQGVSFGSYVGRSTDDELFRNSQSGGVASAIMLYALEKNIVDAAVTVAMGWGESPRAEVVLAGTKENIVRSQKSKYCPVPVLKALRELDERNIKKVALVGTPCQIHGLMNMMDHVPHMAEKVVLKIGLFCAGVMTCAAIDHLISLSRKESNASVAERSLVYRDKEHTGYPGHVRVIHRSGSSVVVDIRARARLKGYYTPVRCRLCFDQMNVFSDISLGDPWGLDLADMEHGENVVVVRSERGRGLFDGMVKDGWVTVRGVPFLMVVNGQSVPRKIREWNEYTAAWRKIGGRSPDYGGRVSRYAWAPVSGDERSDEILGSISFRTAGAREELIQEIEKESINRYCDVTLAARMKTMATSYGEAVISRLLEIYRGQG